MFEKCLAPLRPLKNISLALFKKIKSFSPPEICTKKKEFFFLFTARLCRGSHTKKLTWSEHLHIGTCQLFFHSREEQLLPKEGCHSCLEQRVREAALSPQLLQSSALLCRSHTSFRRVKSTPDPDTLEKHALLLTESNIWGNPNGGLANGGLAQKAPIGPKKALSGEFLLLPAAVRCGGIGPNQPQKGPGSPRKGSNQARKGPIFPEGFLPDFL